MKLHAKNLALAVVAFFVGWWTAVYWASWCVIRDRRRQREIADVVVSLDKYRYRRE